MFENFTTPGKKQFVVIKRQISNWGKTARLIYVTEEPEEVLTLLHVELTAYDRDYNRLRLYQRFSKLRRIKERENLFKLLEDIEYDETLLKHLGNQFKLNIYLAKNKIPMDQILMFIKAEVSSLKRPYIIDKLYGYYHRLRQLKEMRRYHIRKDP